VLTNNKCSHLDGVITIEIMKFFNTHLKTFSCNFLRKQKINYIQEDIEKY